MSTDKQPEQPQADDTSTVQNDSAARQETFLRERREALQKIAIGGGVVVAGAHLLPQKWLKPVVDWVVVPAHAQTSAPQGPQTLPTTTPLPGPQ